MKRRRESRRRALRRSHVAQLERLEPRMMLTAGGIQELTAQELDMVADHPYEGLVATFKSPGAVSHDFAATIDWKDSAAADVERDLKTSGMVRPYGDRFGVFAQHIYTTARTYPFEVTVYDIDETSPVGLTDAGAADVVDGSESFEHATMRGLPENLFMVEGQPYSDRVLVFADTNSDRTAGDYTATIAGFSVPAATVLANGDGTYSVWPDVAQTFDDEQVSELIVEVTAGTETLSVDVPYLVQGAPLIVSALTIPTPVNQYGDPIRALDDILATFTDANPESDVDDFSVVVQWGDGSVNTSDDLDEWSSPYVWMTEDAITHEFQVHGIHAFPTPGEYQIEVRVLEDEHSRDAATSTVTIGQPPPVWPPFYETWVRMYCDGSSVMGMGDPPLDFNVLDQTVRTFGDTVRGQAGEALNSVELGHYTFINDGDAVISAQVRWEPGGPWEAAIVNGSVITGSHTYATPGSYPISVSLQLDDTYVAGDPMLQQCFVTPRVRNYTIASGAIIESAPPTIITSSPAPIAAGSQILASDLFTASDLLDNAVATIQWGDGDISLVEFTGNAPQGSHTYANHGFLTASITVYQEERIAVAAVDVTVEPAPGTYSPPLAPTGARGTATVNQDLLESGIVVATIDDTNPRHIGGLHQVDVSWGDGASSSLGRIQWSAGSSYTITGERRYTDAGVYPLRFQYQDQFDEATFDGTILVTPAALTAVSIGSNAAVAAIRSDWLVAQFTSDNDQTTAGRFQAMIDWGDGFRSEGVVVGAAGQFAVFAPHHAYGQPGTFETTVFVQSGYGTRQTLEIISAVTVAEVEAGPVSQIDVVDYELIDWYQGASGGGPGDPPPGPMKAAGYTMADVDIVRGPGGMWRYVDTKKVYVGHGGKDDEKQDGGDAKIIYSDWVNDKSIMSDGSDLPGTPAISQEMRILWDDGKPDAIDAIGAEFSQFAPAITRMEARHVYDIDTFNGGGSSSSPLEPIGRIYGVDIPRDIDIADGAIDIPETQTVIYGFEDQPLNDIPLLTFTKHEFAEQDATATAFWGDGTQDVVSVVVNADNTLTFLLDHTYPEEGEYALSVIVESSGGVSRVVTADVVIINPDLAFDDVHPFATAQDEWSGDVPLATIPATAWHPPWAGLGGNELDEARDAFRPQDMFLASVDWGDGTTSAGTFRLDDDDSLVILAAHTYSAANPTPYDIQVKLTDQSPFPIQFATQATVVDEWQFEVLARTNGFGEGYRQSIGPADVLVNTAGLEIRHTLDFDISPGTHLGRDPALVYNSNTVHVRPILEGHIESSSTGTLPEAPASTSIQLAWNDRSAQPWRTYNSTNRVAGDVVLAGDQVLATEPVEQSGLYPWTVQARMEFNTFALPLYVAQQGEAEVVVQDTGDLYPLDAFDSEPFYGPGWGINLFERLIVHANGDLLWVDAAGNSRKYEAQSDGTYDTISPTDFGSMAPYDNATYTIAYTARDNTTYTFNHLGLLDSINAPADGVMQFSYDAEGQVTEVSAPDASTTTLDYSDFRLAEIHETGNRTFSLTHGSSIQTIHDVDGSVRSFTYDGTNHLLTDTWGVLASSYVYAPDTEYGPDTERLVAVDRGLGSVYLVVGNDTVSVPARIDPNVPALVADTNDPTGLVTDPLDRIREFTLDEQGRIEGLVGPDQDQLSDGHNYSWIRNPTTKLVDSFLGPFQVNADFLYNDKGSVTSTTRGGQTCAPDPQDPTQQECTTGDSHTVGTQWHGTFQQLTEYTDELGNVTQIVRDANTGLPTEQVDALGQSPHFVWTNLRLMSTTDRRGKTTTREYDTHRRLHKTIDPYGNETQRTYDAAGNLSTVRDPLGRVTEYFYDSRNRLIRVRDALGNDTKTEYDASGLVVERENANGVKTQYEYDQRGLVRQVHEAFLTPVARTTFKDYDLVGNLTHVEAPGGRHTSYIYDALDQRVQMTDPMLGVTKYEYDDRGDLTRQRDPEGRWTYHMYDEDHRRTYTIDAELESTQWQYDAVGNLISETDELDNPTTYSYDVLNRRITRTNASGVSRSYAYDAVGNLVQETDELDRPTDYLYDDLNRRTQIVDRAGYSRMFGYDAVGNLIGETDQEGRSSSYDYDLLDRRVVETGPEGGVRDFTYDAIGNLTSETDELGNPTTYSYDVLNRLVTSTNALGVNRSYAYDAVGNLAQETDELLRTTTYAYDALNRKVEMVDALTGHWTWGYDGVGNLTSQTDAKNYPSYSTYYTYDTLNRRTEDRDEFDESTFDVYDEVGNLTRETDKNGHWTDFQYNELDQRTSMTDREGGQTVYQYDSVGDLIAMEDPEGRTSTYSYDPMHRRTTVNAPGARHSSTAYDGVGNVTLTADANDHETTYTYDGRNRLLTTTDALGQTVTNVYDLAGNLTSQTDPLGHVTTHGYNALNRRIETTDPLLNVTDTHYDVVGNVTQVEDPLGHSTDYEFDALNRLILTTDPLSGTTQYEYDAVGNRTSLTDPAGNETTWTYDRLSRMTEARNALNKARTFTYDAMSNLVARTDRNGREIEYDYDDLQRRTEERWLDGSGQPERTITTAWDAIGRMTSISGPDSNYAYGYNDEGDVESVEHQVAMLGQTIRFDQTFDPAGNRTQVAALIDAVADFTTDYTFDDVNRVTRIQQSGIAASKRVDFGYDTASQFATVTRYNDLAATQSIVVSTYTWDDDRRLTGLSHGTLATYGWTYDAADRLTGTTSPDGSADYTYDDTNQLTAADYDYQGDESYTYDANGNRTMTGYTTGTNNQTTSDGTYNYTYDDEGNRTGRTTIATGEATEYSWDHRNRLTKIVSKDAQGQVTGTVEYRYDPFNRRMAKVVAPAVGPAAVEHFIYDGAAGAVDDDKNIVLRFDTSGEVAGRYLHGPAVDMVLADEQLDTSTGAVDHVYWPLADNLGTVRDLAEYDEATGITSIANHIEYDAFGTVTSETNAAVDTIFGFTGRETDQESDLYYYRARYYDPAIGQFAGEDPIGFDANDPNLRRYVGNGPVDAADPSGLEFELPWYKKPIQWWHTFLHWRQENHQRQDAKYRQRVDYRETIEAIARGDHGRAAQRSLGMDSIAVEFYQRELFYSKDLGSSSMERLERDCLNVATGLTQDEAVLPLIHLTIRATGQDIVYNDEFYLNHPGRWPFDAAVATASNPLTYPSLLVGVGGVVQSGRRFLLPIRPGKGIPFDLSGSIGGARQAPKTGGAIYDAGRVPGLNPNNLRQRAVTSPTLGEGGVYLKPQNGRTKVGSTGDYRGRYGGNASGGIEVEVPQTRFGRAADDSAYRWSARRQRRFDEGYLDRITPGNVKYRAPNAKSPVDQSKWEQFRHIFGYGDLPANFGS